MGRHFGIGDGHGAGDALDRNGVDVLGERIGQGDLQPPEPDLDVQGGQLAEIGCIHPQPDVVVRTGDGLREHRETPDLHPRRRAERQLLRQPLRYAILGVLHADAVHHQYGH